MILSDLDIAARLVAGDLVIEPLDLATQLQPASVDLRLGADVIRWIRPDDENNDAIDVAKLAPARLMRKHEHRATGELDEDGMPSKYDGAILIQPGEFMLGTTIERVRIPVSLAARVEGRSSIGRLGLAVHVTAGFIDPGFEGQITLEIVNFNPYPIWLRPGMRIAQLVFHETKTAGSGYRGKYQGQEGTTESRVHVDFDRSCGVWCPGLGRTVDTCGLDCVGAVCLRMKQRSEPTLPGIDVAPPAPSFAKIAVDSREIAAGFTQFPPTSAPVFAYTGPEPRTMQEAEEIAIAERAFRKLATRISTAEVETRLRAALERFVGEPLTTQVRDAMRATTAGVLAEIVRETRLDFTTDEIFALASHAVRTR